MSRKSRANNPNIIERKATRVVFLLLVAAFCWLGLILNVKAQALADPEQQRIHTFRPLFIRERVIPNRLHPAVILVNRTQPDRIANPTSHGDTAGLVCQGCHQERDLSAQSAVGLAGQGFHFSAPQNGLTHDCQACHPAAAEASLSTRDPTPGF